MNVVINKSEITILNEDNLPCGLMFQEPEGTFTKIFFPEAKAGDKIAVERIGSTYRRFLNGVELLPPTGPQNFEWYDL